MFGLSRKLNLILKNQAEMLERIMSTGNTVTDLNNSVAAIQSAVTAAATELTQLVTDVNAAIVALKNEINSQPSVVTQAALDAVVNQNATILTNLQALTASMTTEDGSVAPAPPTPAPEPAS